MAIYPCFCCLFIHNTVPCPTITLNIPYYTAVFLHKVCIFTIYTCKIYIYGRNIPKQVGTPRTHIYKSAYSYMCTFSNASHHSTSADNVLYLDTYESTIHCNRFFIWSPFCRCPALGFYLGMLYIFIFQYLFINNKPEPERERERWKSCRQFE